MATSLPLPSAALLAVNTAVNAVLAGGQDLNELRTLASHSATLVRNPQVACDFGALAHCLWDVFDRHFKASPAAAAATSHVARWPTHTGQKIAATLMVLAALYDPDGRAAQKPTTPDLESVIGLATAVASNVAAERKEDRRGASPPSVQFAVLLASWRLLQWLVPVDAPAVLKHLKHAALPAVGRLPLFATASLLNVLGKAVDGLLRMPDVANRCTLAGELLAEVPGCARYDIPVINTIMPLRAAPHMLDELARSISVHKRVVASARSLITKIGASGDVTAFDSAVRERLSTTRASGNLTVLHLGAISGIGDASFLVQLLERRLTGSPAELDASEGPLRLVLPIHEASEAASRALVDSAIGTSNLLLACTVANGADAGAQTSASSSAPLRSLLSNDAALTRLVDLFFDSALRVNAGELAVGSTAGSPPPVPSTVVMEAVLKLVLSAAKQNVSARETVLSRVWSAAEHAHAACHRMLVKRHPHLKACAAHGYTIQRVARRIAGELALHSTKHARGSFAADAQKPPSAASTDSAGSQGGGQASAASSAAAGKRATAAILPPRQACRLLMALADLQPVCLVHRSSLKKSPATRQLATRDWQSLRAAGYHVVGAVVANSAPAAEVSAHVRNLLQAVRKRTKKPGMETNVFDSEPLYFLLSMLNHKLLVDNCTASDMLGLWVPAAVRCILASQSPALRQAGHMALVVPLMWKHPATLRVFPTYVNLFVSSPRSRREAAERAEDGSKTVVGYGPVPLESLKQFNRYFKLVARAVETIHVHHARPAASASAGEDGKSAGAGATSSTRSDADDVDRLVDGPNLVKWAVRQLASVSSFYLAIPQPTADQQQRRRLYFCTLIDSVQLANPVALTVACAAIEALLLQLTNSAEAYAFLDYASGAVQASTSLATKTRMAEWLLLLREKLEKRQKEAGSFRRAKL